jgi:hypothetical protein
MITQHKVKDLFDYRDGKLFRKGTGKEAGSYDDKGYRRIQIDGKTYKTHRLVWLWHTGDMPDLYVDHINHIVDDNRIENLRLATLQENKRNSSKKGVTYRAKRDKWETTYCGKYVGLYETWEEAVTARYQAEIRDGMNLRTAL